MRIKGKEGGGRILLGDKRDSGTLMLRLITFQYV
jgi:hypothetical protein